MTKAFYELPRQPREDIVLNQPNSWLGVILPERSMNLVYDPETLAYASGNATYYGLSCTISADPAIQKRGLSSIHAGSFTHTLGRVAYNLVQGISANIAYSFSVDHLGGQGLGFLLIVERVSDSQRLAAVRFSGARFWQRPSLTFVSPQNTVARIVIAIADDPSDGRYQEGFWVDGWQFEEKAHSTTFLSGDEVGFSNEFPNAYLWTGTPHNSPSIRLESTRSGGRVHLLSELGFLVTGFSGLGLIEPDNQIQQTAVDHGGVFSGSLLPQREWTISGVVCETDGILDLHATRQRLIRAMSPMFGRPQQPVRFHYQVYDCATPISDTLIIDAVYSAGLDLKINNHFTESIDIDLVSPDPFVYDSGGNAAVLVMNDGTLPGGLEGLPARDETNTWRITTPLPEGAVWDLELGSDGNMYCALNDKVYRWNGKEWVMLVDTNGTVYDLVATPDRYLYILGNYSVIAGSALTYSHVSRLNLITGAIDNVSSTVVAGAIGKAVYCGVHHFDGKLMIGGNFTSVANTHGSALCKNVAALDLATLTWEILGLPGVPGIVDVDGEIYSMDVSPAGSVVAGGRFIHEGSLVAQNLAIINPYEDVFGWRTLNHMKWEDSVTNAHVNVVKYSPDGLLWVGGRFNNSALPDYFLSGDVAPGEHSPLTNIGYIPGVAGEIRNILPTDPLLWRIYPVEEGTTPTFTNGVSIIGSEVRDLAFDCRGSVFVVGLFDATLRATSVGPVPTERIVIRATTAHFAVIDLQRTWVQPGIIFYPYGFSSATTLPLAQIHSVAYGKNCYPSGSHFPFGRGIQASPNITTSIPGVPSNYVDSLFLGCIITAVLAPFIVFPRRTEVDTQCSVNAKPVIRFLGPGRPKRITNRSTSSTIEFLDNTNLLEDEMLIIDLSGRIPRVLSNFNQNAYTYLRNVNQLSQFRLEIGENQIDLLYDNLNQDGTTNPNSRAWIQWRKRYESVDALSCYS